MKKGVTVPMEFSVLSAIQATNPTLTDPRAKRVDKAGTQTMALGANGVNLCVGRTQMLLQLGVTRAHPRCTEQMGLPAIRVHPARGSTRLAGGACNAGQANTARMACSVVSASLDMRSVATRQNASHAAGASIAATENDALSAVLARSQPTQLNTCHLACRVTLRYMVRTRPHQAASRAPQDSSAEPGTIVCRAG